VQTYPLVTYPLRPFSVSQSDLVDWCGKCCYFAAGSNDADFTTGLIELFKGNACLLPAPTNLHAQKLYHRFPTQIDIINTLCWDSVVGAVAYNVYADANLTILLATITNPPLCYSQHQICKGKSSTYYVTAVDANGIESKPAVVII